MAARPAGTKILVISIMSSLLCSKELPLSHFHVYKESLLHPLILVSDVLEKLWKVD